MKSQAEKLAAMWATDTAPAPAVEIEIVGEDTSSLYVEVWIDGEGSDDDGGFFEAALTLDSEDNWAIDEPYEDSLTPALEARVREDWDILDQIEDKVKEELGGYDSVAHYLRERS